MNNITTIPLAELNADLTVSLMEARTCEKLLATGYDKRLAERLEGDRQIIETIQKEIERRENE